MAKMIPIRKDEEFGTNFAERDVYRMLSASLPSSATVIHSYKFTMMENGFFIDGEADFIVLIPGVGTCVLEVKGARRFKYTDSAWHRYDSDKSVVMDDPFAQATKNKHSITNLIKRHLCLQYYPGRYAHLVVFPRGELQGEMPAAHARSLLITQSEMSFLEDRIVQAIGQASVLQLTLTEQDAEKVARALTVAGEIVPLVSDEFEYHPKRIENLTLEQHLTSQAMRLQRVVIHGPAGSGKTMLATYRAMMEQELACGRVLFTCFNKNLAEWLRSDLSQRTAPQITNPHDPSARGIHVSHFHELCYRYVSIAGRLNEWNELVRNEDFWKQTAPIFLDEVTAELAENLKFDSIVVDEGQDFDDLWILKLQLLLRNRSGGRFMLCLGDGQRLFTSERQVLQNCDAVLKLGHNCRSTKCIATMAAEVRYCQLLCFGIMN